MADLEKLESRGRGVYRFFEKRHVEENVWLPGILGERQCLRSGFGNMGALGFAFLRPEQFEKLMAVKGS